MAEGRSVVTRQPHHGHRVTPENFGHHVLDNSPFDQVQSLGVHDRPMGSTIIVHCLGFPWFSTGDHKVHTLVVKSGNRLLPVSLDG